MITGMRDVCWSKLLVANTSKMYLEILRSHYNESLSKHSLSMRSFCFSDYINTLWLYLGYDIKPLDSSMASGRENVASKFMKKSRNI